MRVGDRLLQQWRIAKALRYLPSGANVLDIGCADGSLFVRAGVRIASGLGIDPDLEGDSPVGSAELRRGTFPEMVPVGSTFDAITMLAVLEHVPPSDQASWAAACRRLLRPGGRLIVTVPSPMVDRILRVLMRLRILDGMETEQHYGFDPQLTAGIFTTAGLALQTARRFQFGLNNIFVFEARR
jgi:2-polyprenyl-3-methyl-5-hydroxy-6-metoxy-1,4-benzoquinol methylase